MTYTWWDMLGVFCTGIMFGGGIGYVFGYWTPNKDDP